MKNLLFLVHRIPYPPNKGDKIRSYHFLKYLATEFNVYLGTFIDDAHDWQYTGKVDALCAETCYQGLKPLPAKIKSLQGLLTGTALSVPYYHHQALQQWVDDTLKNNVVDHVLVFSSVMAQFVPAAYLPQTVVDFVDIDSDKWRQYAEKKSGVARWVYRREARTLLEFEAHVARQAQQSVFVSEQEAALFKQLAPAVAAKIGHINNGVDTDYFSPEHRFESPYQADDTVLVFTGAMDYWANVDAVVWFAEQVFPQLQARYPALKFYIVGSNPNKTVQALATGNIIVTGRVDDVRPYLAHAQVAVAPLRIARGIQNKVLEAMAMGNYIVATTAALEGIAYDASLAVAVSDDADGMAQQLTDRLQNPTGDTLCRANRDFVKTQFSWAQNVHRLAALLQGSGHD
jgi:sugar transferase (PEP-CTERM/EpsH1 system associated)